jgi:hypothetical protein
MSVPVVRRSALLLGVLLSIAIFKCGSIRHRSVEVFCETGNGSKSRPMICVDERTLTANPSPAFVCDVEGENGHPTNRTVVIHWFTKRSADLHVDFKTDACTEAVQCDGRGHCWARVKKLNRPDEHRRCTYGMTLGKNMIDPDGDVVVDPCCT